MDSFVITARPATIYSSMMRHERAGAKRLYRMSLILRSYLFCIFCESMRCELELRQLRRRLTPRGELSCKLANDSRISLVNPHICKAGRESVGLIALGVIYFESTLRGVSCNGRSYNCEVDSKLCKCDYPSYFLLLLYLNETNGLLP